MPLAMQAKLLRVLREKEFTPVGEKKAIKANFRVIAATNQDIDEQISKGLFRNDLYHRLKVLHIKLTPLRERRDDIPLLTEFFVKKCAEIHCITPPPIISPEAMTVLMEFDYSGNAGELHNKIEVACVTCKQGVIRAADIPKETATPKTHTASNAYIALTKNHRDGLDPVRVKLDVDEEMISEGKTSAERGRVMYPDSNNPTQILGNFYGHGDAVRVFDNTDEAEARQRWPYIIRDLLTKRRKALKNYPDWLKKPPSSNNDITA